jgi:hypothetical protein
MRRPLHPTVTPLPRAPRTPRVPRTLFATAPLLLGQLAACASGRHRPPEQVNITPTTVRIETPTGAVEARTVAEDHAETRTINVKPQDAWAKLPAVYAELGLPVTAYIDQTKQLASKGTRVRGRLGKVRLSTLVTCGTDVTGDDKANTYEVTIDVATVVAPNPNGQTDLMTMVTANARPMAVSGEPVRCTTTGSLEKRIALSVVAKTATP